jgi:hypothetical protein
MMLACVCCSSSAFAQNGAIRPYSSLFEGTGSAPGPHQNLNLSLSAAEVYDDNQLVDAGGGAFSAGSPIEKSGFYTGFDGALGYDWTGTRVQFAANAGSNVRYYGDTHQLVPMNYGGGVGLSAAFARRSRFFFNQSISYLPPLFYSVLPALGAPAAGDVVGAGSDSSLAQQAGYISDTTTSLSVGVTARSSVTVLGNYRAGRFAGVSGPRDYRSYAAGGRYEYTVSRNATLRLGYVRRQANYLSSADGRPVVVHDIDAGVDYHRALSFSRRTRIDFSVGSAVTTAPLNPDGSAGQQQTAGNPGQLQYRAIAKGGLNQDFGRTWKARLSYNRGIGYLEAFRQPILSDAVSLSVGGFFSRRVDFHVNGGVSVGHLGTAASSQNQFHSYTADSRLRFAFASRWAMYGEYLFYDYGAGAAVVLPSGVPPSLGRNSARVGLTWWLPLVKR